MTQPESDLVGTAVKVGPGRLYRDAGSMALASVFSAVLGAGFWALAAKIYPPERLGVMTAVLSVISASGLMVAGASGNVYTTLIPAVGASRMRLFRRGQRFHLGLALIFALGGAAVTVTSLPQIHNVVGVFGLVAVGILVYSAFTLQDSTLISIGRARWLPLTNAGASLGRIALLPILAFTLDWHSVEVAFVTAAAIVVMAFRPVIRRIMGSDEETFAQATISEDQALAAFNKLAFQMLSLAILSIGVTTLMPFLVTKLSNASEGALFALCFIIIQMLDAVGSAMGVSLVVHAASSPHHGAVMARSVLLRSLALAILGAVILTVAVPVVLPLLDPKYGTMGITMVIAWLGVGSVVRVLYSVWADLQRSRRRMRAILAINFVSATVLFATISIWVPDHGAIGGALALLASKAVLAGGAGVHTLLSRGRNGVRHTDAPAT